MTKTRQEERAAGQPGIEKIAIPLAVLTVTVDGKRLTLPFYKQIAEEDVIDEQTGDLRGTPVGYFNLHPKEGCPQAPHKHVLWGAGTRLRLATVVPRELDPRFSRRERISQQHRSNLIDLLALLLVRMNHTYTLEGTEHISSKLVIAGYTLFVSADIAQVLKVLDHAQQQRGKDSDILATQAPGEAGNLETPSDPCRDQVNAAEAALHQLAELGFEVAHPDLYRFENKDSSSRSNMRVLQGWHAYPSERSDEQGAALLYWKTNDFHHRMERERFAPIIEPHLASHAYALRVLLAERVIQLKHQEIEELAEQLAEETSVTSRTATGTKEATTGQDKQPPLLEAIDPKEVWKRYEQEKTQFQALRERWDCHLAMINGLEQLFLL